MEREGEGSRETDGEMSEGGDGKGRRREREK